jgi:NADPH-dependent curcumin reductase CurA
VYESVGGETFDICVNSLAVKGRLIVIGFISGYQDQSGWVEGKVPSKATPLPVKLLAKSASIRGFFLNHYTEHFKRHTVLLTKLMQEGKLHSKVDDTKKFIGLESIPNAIDHMFSGQNVGKIVVQIATSVPSKL